MSVDLRGKPCGAPMPAGGSGWRPAGVGSVLVLVPRGQPCPRGATEDRSLASQVRLGLNLNSKPCGHCSPSPPGPKALMMATVPTTHDGSKDGHASELRPGQGLVQDKAPEAAGRRRTVSSTGAPSPPIQPLLHPLGPVCIYTCVPSPASPGRPRKMSTPKNTPDPPQAPEGAWMC